MAELRHLVSAETVAQLNRLKPILGDPTKFHKTKFVAYLEHQADYIFELLVKNGMSKDEAFVATQKKLEDMTREWKAAAKAKAQR